MLVGIQDEILRLHAKGLLAPLLVDKATKRNIIWATDAYRALGFPYERTQEILPALITGEHSDVIKTRARKEMEQQSERTRRHAEVFTPLAICRQMIGDADAAYFGGVDPFMVDGVPSARVSFPRRRKWQHYVDARRLEITCGEAPYLVHRYDVATMEGVPLAERQGVLDRKLRIVCENVADETEWMRWTLRAYQATYGYEFQGDNLLIARVNLLMTFEEYLRARWRRKPTAQEYRAIIRTIAWNLWQMDGIRGTIPYAEESEPMELMLFDLPEEIEELRLFPAYTGEIPPVRIYDWRRQSGLEYRRVNTGGRTMKFDFVIGNPPYNEDFNNSGDNANFAKPIYNLFIDEARKVSDKVTLIHPARFLFNAGSTPKDWNKKILSDKHFKVLCYEPNSAQVFPETDIKGGVAITYYDAGKTFEPIGTFTAFEELNSILKKVAPRIEQPLGTIISGRGVYRLSTKALEEHPEIEDIQSKGHKFDVGTGAFQKLEEIVFFKEKPLDNEEYVQFLGLMKGKRVWYWARKDFLDPPDSFYTFKVFIPEANGSGALGEVLSTPLIGAPLIGATETFLSIGEFATEGEAANCLKYVKSKFARAMLGVLKITQHNTREKWIYVPLQDFSSSSDIDWSQSIAEIDQQLYTKYGLSAEEIAFIESHVKEMA